MSEDERNVVLTEDGKLDPVNRFIAQEDDVIITPPKKSEEDQDD